jgi:CheY-like chemotaxis protein
MRTEPKSILLFCDDLFFAARIESVLKHLGFAPQTVMTVDAALHSVETLRPVLAIVRYDAVKPEPFDLTRTLKSLPEPIPVLGFMPHVQIPETRSRAKEAGCNLLVPNSSIVQKLPQILARLLPDSGEADFAGAAQFENEE